MANEVVTEWTLDGVLDELARIHSTMRDRQFAFILGSGASFTSGIPTGHDLAQRWIKDLYLRECADQRSIDEWMADCSIGGGKLTLDSVAEYYPQIFERRFDGDREAGYAELEAAMEGKSPSLGYSLLAEIIQRTRHKVIVTTNFDNLVADALAMHAHQSPLVVAHESLAGFVRPQLRRPLVAKIHRDLFLQPLNDVVGVSTMEKGWRIALKKLFQYFTPVVVGYGGNDGSLMDMLVELNEGDIAGRMVWCYREGSRPPPKALAVLQKHKGLLVKIAGFDEFMLRLAAKLVDDFDVAAIAERTAKLGQDRAERYREQASKLHEASARGSAEKQKAGTVMRESVRSGKSWWSWEMQSRSAASPEERNRIYLEGLQLFPGSAELIGNYANFLADQRKDYDAAEVMYKKALELNPSDADYTGNYAIFLADQRKSHDAAESMYKKALELDPSHANNTNNYANFLADQRKNYDAAESMFKKAIELDPSRASNTGSYAIFLADQRKDYDAAESMFKKALELDPSHANNANNYAIFLADHRKDYDAAETMYKRALEFDPSDATHTGNYAIFLAHQRKDYDAAEVMFKKALELDPSHTNNTNNYANFLADQRKDYDAAEAMHKKALELNPSDADHTGNYAIFLADQRKDYDAAEVMFKKALELDPSHANNTNNYANFLADQRKNYDAAESMFKKAIELDPSRASNTGSYAIFLADQRKDYDAAESMFKRALELDPSHANNANNYAIFLADHRKDYDAAEVMHKKALELNPSDADHTGNYAIFLAHQRKDHDAAEVMFKKALTLDPDGANNIVNFASLLLTQGGATSLNEVVSLVERMLELSRPAVSQMVAEGLLYGALVNELLPEAQLDAMLGRLKGALLFDYSRESWDFSPMLAAVLPRLPAPRRDLFRILAEAVLNKEHLPVLDSIEAWRKVQTIDPFAN